MSRKIELQVSNDLEDSIKTYTKIAARASEFGSMDRDDWETMRSIAVDGFTELLRCNPDVWDYRKAMEKVRLERQGNAKASEH